MGGKSERFIMRVDADTLASWRVEATEQETSVAALITRRMCTKAIDREVVGHALDAARQSSLDEIAALKQTIAAQARKIATLEKGITQGLGRSIAIDAKAHHPAGPVLVDPVPRVVGQAIGFNLKSKGKAKP